jgi:hypothetical protein
LNPRPHPYQGCALPTELLQRLNFACLTAAKLSAFDRSPRRFYRNKNKKPFSFKEKRSRLKTETTLSGDSSPKERGGHFMEKGSRVKLFRQKFFFYSQGGQGLTSFEGRPKRGLMHASRGALLTSLFEASCGIN